MKKTGKLCFTLQRYKIESNSQRIGGSSADPQSCVLHCKDTKLKAIHNLADSVNCFALLCFTLQRYKIESNSQLSHNTCLLNAVVFYTAKIQN